MTAPTIPADLSIPDDELAASLEAYVERDPVGDSEPEPAAPPEADQPEPDAQEPDSMTPEPVAAEADQPPADPFADLLKDAKPLAYKVSGAERTDLNILELPNGNGFIPADKLAEVRNLVARYESNAEANKDLYAFRQQVDRLGGMPKFHEIAEKNEQLNAASLLILDALTTNPRQFVNNDGTPNTEQIQFFIERASIAAERARYKARESRTEQESKWTAEASESEVRQTAIPNAIQSLAPRFNLAPEDVQAAQAHFGPFVDSLLFKATPEQALQFGVAPGTLMVDLPKMEPWFTDRAQRRAEMAEQVKARSAAQKENAVRVPVKPPAPKPTRPRNKDGQFVEQRKHRTKDEMMNRALAGLSNDPDDE